MPNEHLELKSFTFLKGVPLPNCQLKKRQISRKWKSACQILIAAIKVAFSFSVTIMYGIFRQDCPLFQFKWYFRASGPEQNCWQIKQYGPSPGQTCRLMMYDTYIDDLFDAEVDGVIIPVEVTYTWSRNGWHGVYRLMTYVETWRIMLKQMATFGIEGEASWFIGA